MFKVQAPQRVILVVGKPGSGKSTLIGRLQSLLGWPVLAIDDYRQAGGRDWPWLVRDVACLTTPALVEAVLFHPHLRPVLARHDAGVIEVVCDEQVRRDRVRHTQWSHQHNWNPRYDWHDKRIVDSSKPLTECGLVDLIGWATHT